MASSDRNDFTDAFHANIKQLETIEVTEKEYNWKFTAPRHSFNQLPGLPIYIGKGLGGERHALTGVSVAKKIKNIHAALAFVDNVLKPIHAKFVVAIGKPYFDFCDYFGGFEADAKSSDWRFWHRSKDISWFSFDAMDECHYTFISKRLNKNYIMNNNFYHLKVFKDDVLYYDGYVLHARRQDGNRVDLYEHPDSLQLIHDMVCEVMSFKNTHQTLFFHCAGGIGRSGVEMLSALTMMQQSSDLSSTLPDKYPKLIVDADYPHLMLKWAHENIRPSLLGYVQRGHHKININQVNDWLKTSAALLKIHECVTLHQSVADRVLLTADECMPILNKPVSLEAHEENVVFIEREKRNRQKEKEAEEQIDREQEEYERAHQALAVMDLKQGPHWASFHKQATRRDAIIS